MPKKKASRPRLFVGSSKESLRYAYAIQANLDEDAEVTVWTQGVFKLSKASVESLVQAFGRSDFAVFVFAPNDVLRLRKNTYNAVRDNVVFELGLFMGRHGRNRTFIVVPKGSQRLRIPTDLLGITPGTFDASRQDRNLQAAFGPFCDAVRSQIRGRGRKVASGHRTKARRDSRLKGDLLVVDAAYGVDNHRVDVAQPLNDKIVDGKLHAYVGNQLAGDPAPNVPKNLVIRYSYKNQKFEKTFNEGETLDLP